MGQPNISIQFEIRQAAPGTTTYPVRVEVFENGRRTACQDGTFTHDGDVLNHYLRWKQHYDEFCGGSAEQYRLGKEPVQITQIQGNDLLGIGSNFRNVFTAQYRKTDPAWVDLKLFLIENLARLGARSVVRLVVKVDKTQHDLYRLPWQFFFQDILDKYPQAEVCLANTNHTELSSVVTPSTHARILAVIGDPQMVQDSHDLQAILGNEAEIEFLVTPEPGEFFGKLQRRQGWDIFYFGGHSITENGVGMIQLRGTEDPVQRAANKIPLAEFREALGVAISQGLKLAIFNSCDGLGLAHTVADLGIPQVVVMREAIPNPAAQKFLTNFLETLKDGEPLHIAVRRARNQLKFEEQNYPCVSWFPLIFQHPTAPPLYWRDITEPPGEPQQPPFHPSTYDPKTWTSRDRELAGLRTAIAAGCQLLLIHGMTGMGKTALAERLATESHRTLPYASVVLDREVGSVEFKQGAIAILEVLGDETRQQLDDNQILPHLLAKLRETPVWLQLDSVEYLLKSSESGRVEFYDPAWGDFLEQVLRDNRCQSRLILTSQALPEDLLDRLERLSQSWYCCQLEGLEEDQYLTLFANCGVTPQRLVEKRFLFEIATYFQGHPYILKMIAADISSPPFGGNVTRYRDDYWLPRQQQETDTLSKEQRARNWVNQTIAHLSELERQMLYYGAVFRRAVPESFYLKMLHEPLEETKAALASLKARALVQEIDIQAGQRLIQQHNLIRDAAYTALKANHHHWETAQRQAAYLWLTDYKVASKAPKLETLRGYLEAFDHYCEVEDWEKATEVYTKSVPSTQNPLHMQLLIWTYYEDLIRISNKLAEHITSLTKTVCLNQLGNVHRNIGKIEKAIEYYEQALKVARDNGDRRGESRSLGCLGLAYDRLKKYAQAIEAYEEALKIARDPEVNDQQGEFTYLNSLGMAAYRDRDADKSIDYYQEALKISQIKNMRNDEGIIFGNLGAAYHLKKNFSEAIKHHKQHLDISIEPGVDDPQGEKNALFNLADTYHNSGNYGEAKKYYKKIIIFIRKVNLSELENKNTGNKSDEGEVLMTLAKLYKELRDNRRALAHCERALMIARENNMGTLIEECEALKQTLETHEHS
jgi:tetratricopeptide (TPR) repeat protein